MRLSGRADTQLSFNLSGDYIEIYGNYPEPRTGSGVV